MGGRSVAMTIGAIDTRAINFEGERRAAAAVFAKGETGLSWVQWKTLILNRHKLMFVYFLSV